MDYICIKSYVDDFCGFNTNILEFYLTEMDRLLSVNDFRSSEITIDGNEFPAIKGREKEVIRQSRFVLIWLIKYSF